MEGPAEGVEEELGPVDDEGLGPTAGAEDAGSDPGEEPVDADTGSDPDSEH
jgi:hypothetical protein